MAHRGRQSADDALALALARGETVRDAALTAGVAERTATRRWADPDFRQRVGQLLTSMVQQALGRMANSMTAASNTLLALLQAEGESVRLGAARSILELGNKLRESVELEERLTALERLQEKTP